MLQRLARWVYARELRRGEGQFTAYINAIAVTNAVAGVVVGGVMGTIMALIGDTESVWMIGGFIVGYGLASLALVDEIADFIIDCKEVEVRE